MVDADVDLPDGNLSKQRRGETDTLCWPVRAVEISPTVESNSVADALEQVGDLESSDNEKVGCALHLSGAEAEDRLAMSQSESASTLLYYKWLNEHKGPWDGE